MSSLVASRKTSWEKVFWRGDGLPWSNLAVYKWLLHTSGTLTRGGRQKGSSPLASYSSGSTWLHLLDEHIWGLQVKWSGLIHLLHFLDVHIETWTGRSQIGENLDRASPRLNMYIKKMKKLYKPTSLLLEPSNVFIQQVEWSGAGIL